MAAEQKIAKPVLGYWNIRGLGQSIRLLLAYAKEDFEDKVYNNDTSVPTTDSKYRAAWTSVKFNLGLDFPNLPYYMDEHVKLTQSNGILRYLARKYKLYGTTPEDQGHADMMTEQAMDFRMATVRVVYNKDYESLKAGNRENSVVPHLQQLEKYLGDKSFLIGEQVTLPDFLYYELLDVNSLMYPDLFAEFPKLHQYHDRVESLDGVRQWVEKTRKSGLPLNGPSAAFGGTWGSSSQ